MTAPETMTTASARTLPTAVLFDMDGTLLDTEHLWMRAETQVMTELGAEWTEADQMVALGGPLERVFAYMKQRAQTDLPGEVIGQMLLGTIEHLLRHEDVTWRPGARSLLLDAHAQELPTALVTGSWRILVDAVHDRIAEDIGREPFAIIVAGDEVPETKPHPAPYLHAAKLLDADIADCMALEDSPTGVTSASTAGALVIAIPHIAPIAMGPRIHTIHTLEGESIASLWGRGV